MSIPNAYVVYSGSEAFATVAPLGEAGTEEVTRLQAFQTACCL